MAQLKITYVDCILINPEILRTSGSMELAIAVTCTLQLENITKREVMLLRGKARAEVMDFYTQAIVTAGDPNVMVPRQPMRLPNTITCYYCCLCGTPLKPGTCKGCHETIPGQREFRDNPAPPLPSAAYRHITLNKRYEFSVTPKVVKTKRKTKPNWMSGH